jgi:hypothetical protein
LRAIVGSWQAETKHYWGICWDLTSQGSKTGFDQAWANEAIDFLAYFNKAQKPKNTAARTTVKDQSPNVSGARANRWLDIGDPHIEDWDAQDMIKALTFAGTHGHRLGPVDFTTTYGAFVTSVTFDKGIYKQKGTGMQLCGKENLCINASANKDPGPTYLPDNAAIGFHH